MNKIWKVIGLMSGTSLDGLDIAYCEFIKTNKTYTFEIKATSQIDYPKKLKEQLKSAIDFSATDLLAYDKWYGAYLGKQLISFITKNKCKPDFIASHGHTIHHQPTAGFTCQIGSGQHIALASGLPVVCDFRSKDVALGGQGAPLVPIGDQLLFSDYDGCINLGGIGNISFEYQEKWIAYDMVPVNMLFNYISKKAGKEFDKDGLLASKGNLNQELLKQLNLLSFYQNPFPKSLGYEWFLEKVVPLIDQCKEPVENILHTAVIHAVQQINAAINGIKKKELSVLITGGGAKNKFFIEKLRQQSNPSTALIIPEKKLIDYKEALIFAFLGVLSKNKEVNSLSSVTGARKNSSSGVWFYP